MKTVLLNALRNYQTFFLTVFLVSSEFKLVTGLSLRQVTWK